MQHAPEDLSFGIAGRNTDKLNSLAEKLGINPNHIFKVDNLNRQEVDEVVSQARIIVTTAGPYSLYGEHVIASCAEHGTHYLDITGEVGFIKQMADKYDELAKKNRCKLIPFSGFDSVPAEVCTYLMSKKFNPEEDVYIKAYYSISGGFNGGTIATMMNKFETGEYKLMTNPKLAMEGTEQELGHAIDRTFFGFDKQISRWSSPFIMSPINSKVVYRTASLMRNFGQPYFKKIAYSEHTSLGKWYNPLPFFLVSLMLLSIGVLGKFSWFRKLVLKLTPPPGHGPSEESIEKGYMKLVAIAKSSSGKRYRIKFSYSGDPSNKATVFFLCESALTLVNHFDELPESATRFGFLTPMSAFGDQLIQNLTKSGYSIVDDL